ncbi:MAG: SDR family oxidoreductase [Rhodobacteraceae bacterium]|nr:SDR family oxidoreductase [Paracoccaceae bacterium]
MMFDVGNKHVLITGATSGLGAHFARFFGEKGARVTLTGRRQPLLDALVKELDRDGISAVAAQMDVTMDSSVAAAFDVAEARFGCADVVINNAGVTGSGRAEMITPETWNTTIDTNLRGVWLVSCEAARRMMAKERAGSIINIASILGLRVAGGVAPYAISKAGVVQMTRQLALEWARHNIRVNALAPGYFETDLNQEFFSSNAGQALISRVPMRRLGQLDELDGPVLLLASQASRFMTGATIEIDGGHLVSGL